MWNQNAKGPFWTVFAAVAAFSGIGMAATNVPATNTIEMISTFPTYAVIEHSGSNTGGCSGVDAPDHFVIDWKGDAGKKVLLSVALAAYALGKRVGFRLDGCHTYRGGTPLASRIDMAD